MNRIRSEIAARQGNEKDPAAQAVAVPADFAGMLALSHADFVRAAGLVSQGKMLSISQMEQVNANMAAGASRAKVLVELRAAAGGASGQDLPGLQEQYQRELRRARLRSVAHRTGLIHPFRVLRKAVRAGRRIVRAAPRLIRLDETLHEARLIAQADAAAQVESVVRRETDAVRREIDVVRHGVEAVPQKIDAMRRDVWALRQQLTALEATSPTFRRAAAIYLENQAASPWDAAALAPLLRGLSGAAVLDLDWDARPYRQPALRKLGFTVVETTQEPLEALRGCDLRSLSAVLVGADATLQLVDDLLGAAKTRLAPGGLVVLPPRVFVGGAECIGSAPVALVPTAFIRALATAHELALEEADSILLIRRPA